MNPHAHSAAPSVPSAANSLTARLRESTKDLHARVERHPVQAALLRGGATIDGYAAYLSQMFHAQSAVDASSSLAAAREPRLQRVLRPFHIRAPHARADLDALERTTAAPAASTTQFSEWVAHVSQHDPIAFLGIVYVLEGSTNGGTYIAAAMRRHMPLPVDRATAFLDPHGPAQRERWAQFKTHADALDMTGPEADRVVDAAFRTFLALEAIFQELPSPAPIAASHA
jgi:heme oxygenase